MSQPTLGAAPSRVLVDADVAQRLVAAQLPQWAGLSVEPVAVGGWDNRTFHLGEAMSLRLPTAAAYAEAVAKEHRWLPVLAPQLPLPVPTPLALGAPSAEYPHPWSVYSWIEGRTASAERIGDPVAFATDLAELLLALQAVDPADGPRPGLHNWHRGGPLSTFDDSVRESLAALEGRIEVDATARLWDDLRSQPWDGVERWLHGDVAEGNLLVDEAGRLCAVIDFGTCGVGDPACDAAVAWTLLTEQGRRAFRERLEVDDATWARGRGWALWKTLATYRGALDDPADRDERERAASVLDLLLTAPC